MARQLSTEEFIERASKFHDGFYNYSVSIYRRRREKIKIICPKHGFFWQDPYFHMTQGGCPLCGRINANKNNSITHMGKKLSEETKEKIRTFMRKNKPNLGRKLSEETKEKIRQSSIKKYINNPDLKKILRIKRIEQIKKNYGISKPNYNLQACNWFKFFDKVNDTNGRYAVYGGGEYYIKEIGYWPDYINFDKKLIIEWDEERHFIDNELKEKDVSRQKEIQNIFPDFEFIRIRKGG